MATVSFVSHPEVAVDPARPVPRWHLSERGVTRARAFARTPGLAAPAAIWASGETKAIETAGIVAARFGLAVEIDEALGENDRSATGFLPPAEFERMADAFFAAPERSVRGWERAVDAQARIVAAVARVIAASPEGDVAIVSHGGVGTLLLCHLLARPIARAMDLPGQGNVFRFDRKTRAVVHGWQSIAPG